MTSNNETVSCQMPWAGNIVKTMTSNGKQFTVTREMLTAVACDQRWPDAVAGISASFSKFAFVLFCYITNHFMTGPLGNNEFCFPSILMFPSTSSQFTVTLGTSHWVLNINDYSTKLPVHNSVVVSSMVYLQCCYKGNLNNSQKCSNHNQDMHVH